MGFEVKNYMKVLAVGSVLIGGGVKIAQEVSSQHPSHLDEQKRTTLDFSNGMANFDTMNAINTAAWNVAKDDQFEGNHSLLAVQEAVQQVYPDIQSLGPVASGAGEVLNQSGHFKQISVTKSELADLYPGSILVLTPDDKSSADDYTEGGQTKSAGKIGVIIGPNGVEQYVATDHVYPLREMLAEMPDSTVSVYVPKDVESETPQATPSKVPAQSEVVSTPAASESALPVVDSLSGDPEQDMQTVISLCHQAFPDNQALAELCASVSFVETSINVQPSQLAMQYKNLFAIRAPGTQGIVDYAPNSPFGVNSTVTESVEQFKRVMEEPQYNGVLSITDVATGAQILQNGGYAGGDTEYASKVVARWEDFVVPRRSEATQPDTTASVSVAPQQTEQNLYDRIIDRNLQQRLAIAAENEAERDGTFGFCLRGVQNALDAAGLSTPRVPAAKFMVDVLRNDPRFVEVDVPREDIPNLRAGDIVVYDGDPTITGDDASWTDPVTGQLVYGDAGHIEVSLGNGEFASDHINPTAAMLNTDIHVFAPKIEQNG